MNIRVIARHAHTVTIATTRWRNYKCIKLDRSSRQKISGLPVSRLLTGLVPAPDADGLPVAPSVYVINIEPHQSKNIDSAVGRRHASQNVLRYCRLVVFGAAVSSITELATRKSRFLGLVLAYVY